MEGQKEKIQKVRDWLSEMIKPMLDHPEDLNVKVTLDAKGVLFTVKVHDIDAGSVIGNSGLNTRSIRTLLGTVGKRHDMRASMILDVPQFKTT